MTELGRLLPTTPRQGSGQTEPAPLSLEDTRSWLQGELVRIKYCIEEETRLLDLLATERAQLGQQALKFGVVPEANEIIQAALEREKRYQQNLSDWLATYIGYPCLDKALSQALGTDDWGTFAMRGSQILKEKTTDFESNTDFAPSSTDLVDYVRLRQPPGKGVAFMSSTRSEAALNQQWGALLHAVRGGRQLARAFATETKRNMLELGFGHKEAAEARAAAMAAGRTDEQAAAAAAAAAEAKYVSFTSRSIGMSNELFPDSGGPRVPKNYISAEREKAVLDYMKSVVAQVVAIQVQLALERAACEEMLNGLKPWMQDGKPVPLHSILAEQAPGSNASLWRNDPEQPKVASLNFCVLLPSDPAYKPQVGEDPTKQRRWLKDDESGGKRTFVVRRSRLPSDAKNRTGVGSQAWNKPNPWQDFAPEEAEALAISSHPGLSAAYTHQFLMYLDLFDKIKKLRQSGSGMKGRLQRVSNGQALESAKDRKPWVPPKESAAARLSNSRKTEVEMVVRLMGDGTEINPDVQRAERIWLEYTGHLVDQRSSPLQMRRARWAVMAVQHLLQWSPACVMQFGNKEEKYNDTPKRGATNRFRGLWDKPWPLQGWEDLAEIEAQLAWQLRSWKEMDPAAKRMAKEARRALLLQWQQRSAEAEHLHEEKRALRKQTWERLEDSVRKDYEDRRRRAEQGAGGDAAAREAPLSWRPLPRLLSEAADRAVEIRFEEVAIEDVLTRTYNIYGLPQSEATWSWLISELVREGFPNATQAIQQALRPDEAAAAAPPDEPPPRQYVTPVYAAVLKLDAGMEIDFAMLKLVWPAEFEAVKAILDSSQTMLSDDDGMEEMEDEPVSIPEKPLQGRWAKAPWDDTVPPSGDQLAAINGIKVPMQLIPVPMRDTADPRALALRELADGRRQVMGWYDASRKLWEPAARSKNNIGYKLLYTSSFYLFDVTITESDLAELDVRQAVVAKLEKRFFSADEKYMKELAQIEEQTSPNPLTDGPAQRKRKEESRQAQTAELEKTTRARIKEAVEAVNLDPKARILEPQRTWRDKALEEVRVHNQQVKEASEKRRAAAEKARREVEDGQLVQMIEYESELKRSKLTLEELFQADELAAELEAAADAASASEGEEAEGEGEGEEGGPSPGGGDDFMEDSDEERPSDAELVAKERKILEKKILDEFTKKYPRWELSVQVARDNPWMSIVPKRPPPLEKTFHELLVLAMARREREAGEARRRREAEEAEERRRAAEAEKRAADAEAERLAAERGVELAIDEDRHTRARTRMELILRFLKSSGRFPRKEWPVVRALVRMFARADGEGDHAYVITVRVPLALEPRLRGFLEELAAWLSDQLGHPAAVELSPRRQHFRERSVGNFARVFTPPVPLLVHAEKKLVAQALSVWITKNIFGQMHWWYPGAPESALGAWCDERGTRWGRMVLRRGQDGPVKDKLKGAPYEWMLDAEWDGVDPCRPEGPAGGPGAAAAAAKDWPKDWERAAREARDGLGEEDPVKRLMKRRLMNQWREADAILEPRGRETDSVALLLELLATGSPGSLDAQLKAARKKEQAESSRTKGVATQHRKMLDGSVAAARGEVDEKRKALGGAGEAEEAGEEAEINWEGEEAKEAATEAEEAAAEVAAWQTANADREDLVALNAAIANFKRARRTLEAELDALEPDSAELESRSAAAESHRLDVYAPAKEVLQKLRDSEVAQEREKLLERKNAAADAAAQAAERAKARATLQEARDGALKKLSDAEEARRAATPLSETLEQHIAARDSRKVLVTADELRAGGVRVGSGPAARRVTAGRVEQAGVEYLEEGGLPVEAASVDLYPAPPKDDGLVPQALLPKGSPAGLRWKDFFAIWHPLRREYTYLLDIRLPDAARRIAPVGEGRSTEDGWTTEGRSDFRVKPESIAGEMYTGTALEGAVADPPMAAHGWHPGAQKGPTRVGLAKFYVPNLRHLVRRDGRLEPLQLANGGAIEPVAVARPFLPSTEQPDVVWNDLNGCWIVYPDCTDKSQRPPDGIPDRIALLRERDMDKKLATELKQQHAALLVIDTALQQMRARRPEALQHATEAKVAAYRAEAACRATGGAGVEALQERVDAAWQAKQAAETSERAVGAILDFFGEKLRRCQSATSTVQPRLQAPVKQHYAEAREVHEGAVKLLQAAEFDLGRAHRAADAASQALVNALAAAPEDEAAAPEDEAAAPEDEAAAPED